MGAAQGGIGWFMVKSGLEEPKVEGQNIHVSPYRLAAHLGSAFAIYCYLFWLLLGMLRPTPSLKPTAALKQIKGLAHAAAGLTFFTALSGAFVAGNDAGLAYPEWPLMGGQISPEYIWDESLKFRNF